MKKLLTAALGTLLTSAGLTFAQPPADPPPTVVATDVTVSAAEPAFSWQDEPAEPRIWIGTEYLLWWVKGQPVPSPLATVNGTGGAPTIGVPGTAVLFGNETVDMGAFSGVRLTLGGWLDNERTLGLEASAFLLEQRPVTAFFGSDITGNPNLGIPFVSPAGVPSSADASTPGLAFGTLTITNTTRLWGYEVNALLNAARSERWSLNFLGGYRYLDLSEQLQYDNPYVLLGTGGINLPFNDVFQTRNQFHGGQLGARVAFNRNRLHVNATGKLGLGLNHQMVNISGASSVIVPGTPTTVTPGGAYTGTTNIGRTTQNQFAVLPQVALQVGYDVTERLRATVGYDILYLNNVVRPGDQIDPRFDGVTFPAPQFEKTNFWAQGVSLGLELRF